MSHCGGRPACSILTPSVASCAAWAALQPVEQRLPVGRRRTGAETVLVAAGVAARRREQVQVVVAEHDDCRVAEPCDEAQHVERARAAIDEVADEPEAVAAG